MPTRGSQVAHFPRARLGKPFHQSPSDSNRGAGWKPWVRAVTYNSTRPHFIRPTLHQDAGWHPWDRTNGYTSELPTPVDTTQTHSAIPNTHPLDLSSVGVPLDSCRTSRLTCIPHRPTPHSVLARADWTRSPLSLRPTLGPRDSDAWKPTNRFELPRRVRKVYSGPRLYEALQLQSSAGPST